MCVLRERDHRAVNSRVCSIHFSALLIGLINSFVHSDDDAGHEYGYAGADAGADADADADVGVVGSGSVNAYGPNDRVVVAAAADADVGHAGLELPRQLLL